MKTNSEQSPDKNRLGAVCRFIGVLIGLLVFIWLPPTEVKASGMVSGVVRDSITKDPLPVDIIITVANVGDPSDGPLIGSFSGSFSTESNEGVYSFDYPWCGFIIKAELDGYEPRTFSLQKQLNPVTLLNLFVLPGFIADAATGSLMKYQPLGYDIALDRTLSLNIQNLEIDAQGNFIIPRHEGPVAVTDDRTGITIVVDN